MNSFIVHFSKLVIALAVFTGSSAPQVAKSDCFKIDHLSFFGLNDGLEVRWSERQIDESIEMELKDPSLERTSWIIPVIAFQLADFHPTCGKSTDLGRLEKLMSLYLTIRRIETRGVKPKSVVETLEFVKADFASLLQNDRTLTRMIAGFDDGPFFGDSLKSIPDLSESQSLDAPFGRLIIGQSDKGVVVAARDMKGKMLWSRLLKGAHSDRYLNRFTTGSIQLQHGPVASVLRVIVDGERLTMYVRPNGRFISYSHSW